MVHLLVSIPLRRNVGLEFNFLLHRTASLQYLDWADVGKYLHLLHEHRDHLLNDSEYAMVLHRDKMTPKSAEVKKESKYGYNTSLQFALLTSYRFKDLGTESFVSCYHISLAVLRSRPRLRS